MYIPLDPCRRRACPTLPLNTPADSGRDTLEQFFRDTRHPRQVALTIFNFFSSLFLPPDLVACAGRTPALASSYQNLNQTEFTFSLATHLGEEASRAAIASIIRCPAHPEAAQASNLPSFSSFPKWISAWSAEVCSETLGRTVVRVIDSWHARGTLEFSGCASPAVVSALERASGSSHNARLRKEACSCELNRELGQIRVDWLVQARSPCTCKGIDAVSKALGKALGLSASPAP